MCDDLVVLEHFCPVISALRACKPDLSLLVSAAFISLASGGCTVCTKAHHTLPVKSGPAPYFPSDTADHKGIDIQQGLM